MEMAFHEGFKQLQARVLQAQVTKQRSTGTVEYVEEGGKDDSCLGPWGITSGSSTAAVKVEVPAVSGSNYQPKTIQHIYEGDTIKKRSIRMSRVIYLSASHPL